MLNAKALGELLSRNSDERLCKRWYLITPNGTLLASSQPADIRGSRRQVAMAALSWQEHRKSGAGTSVDGTLSSSPQRQLCTLIIESETSNVLIRQIQPRLLLVLEGGVPPRRRAFETRTTAEDANGQLLHDRATGESYLGTSISSKAESSISTATVGVLALHRKKLDAMAAAIQSAFEQTGFKMPEEGVSHLF